MMFALIITGLILKKVGVVGKEVQKGMTNLVIDLILPCNIIYSFMIKFSSKIAQDFVVILVIYEGFNVDADAGLCGQDHDLRVVQVLRTVVGGLAVANLSGSVILAEQPA